MPRLLRAVFALAILTIGLDQYRPFLGGDGNFSDVLFQIVLVASAAQWLVQLEQPGLRSFWEGVLRSEILIWGGILLTAGATIASLGSEAPSHSWVITAKYFYTFCVWVPWVAAAIEQYLSAGKAYGLYVAGFCLIAFATVSDLFLGTHFGARLVSMPGHQIGLDDLAEGIRYGGPTGHPNTLGYLSTIGALLCLSAIGGLSWRRGWAPLVGLVACGGALLASGSRAAFLGLVVGCLILLAFSGRMAVTRIGTTIAACVVALLIVVSATGFGAAINPVTRLTESTQARRGFEADWGRTRDLHLAQRLLSHDPLTGYGMEDIALDPFPTKVAFNLPHFVVLESWVAGGVLALLGNLWVYAATLWLGWRAVREGHSIAPGLLASCAAFIVTDMVHPGLDQRFKWFAAALLISTLHSARRSSRLEEIPPSIKHK